MLVKSEEIENWADTGNAAGEFPRLLACLILGSCSDITNIAMPGGMGVFCGGKDGHTECVNGNAFVPGGISHWELSTEAESAAKATRDFDKRVRRVKAGYRSQQTFVFATPRKWPGAQAWCIDKRKQSKWKDVKVITSDQIEKWFELAPWVARNFIFGKNCGAGVPEGLWQIWLGYETVGIDSKLDPDFVIGGRTGAVDYLARWLNSPDTIRELRLYGSTHREAKDFVAACVAKMPDEKLREQHFQRVIVVEDKNTAQLLSPLHSKCIILTVEGDAPPTVYQVARRSGCRVIVCCKGNAGGIISANQGYYELELGRSDEKEIIQQVGGQVGTISDAARICDECNFDYVKIRQEIFKC